jgi:hypothetical protein
MYNSSNRIICLLGGIVLLATAGCGDDPDSPGGAACTMFTACGGNLAPGTYKVTSACTSRGVASITDTCKGSAEVSDLKITGTRTLNANLTYSSTDVVLGTIKLALPSSCFTEFGVSDCSELEEAFQGDPDIMKEYKSVACSGTPVCTCLLTSRGTENKETGTYRIAGSAITFTATGEEPVEAEFCAAGSATHVKMYPFSSGNRTGEFSIVETWAKQ